MNGSWVMAKIAGTLSMAPLASSGKFSIGALKLTSLYRFIDDLAPVALLGGQTEAAIFAVGTSSGQMRQGALRAIAVLSPQESPFLPGVPTARSQGYDIVAGSTRGFVGPAGLPPDVQARLAGALERAILSPEHGERMRQLNIPITFEGPAGFADYWATEERQLRPLLEELLREGRTQ